MKLYWNRANNFIKDRF